MSTYSTCAKLLDVLSVGKHADISSMQEFCDIHSLHAFCGHWILCLWDHGCVLPCGIPLPPVVHQHKGDGHGQARSEQETVHAVHAEVSWVCRNGALHAGGILVFYIFPDWPIL